MKNKIIHKRSSTIIEGKAKLPTVEQLEYGELAINYANDVETIAFKNNKDEIVEIRSNKYFEKVIKDNELVTSSALNNLNQSIQDVSTKLSNYVTDDELSQKGFLVGEETSEELDDVETNTYVKYVVQTLTDEQKNQVRENLGIPSVDYIISLFEELKTLINNNSALDAIAVLDKAILDMHKLQ